MKKAILSTSLALIPNTIQYRALTKALNYLFLDQSHVRRFDGVIVSFKLTDLRKVWTFAWDGQSFSPYKKKKSKVDVTCSLRSDVALSLHSKAAVVQAVESGHIEFAGEAVYVGEVTALLNDLEAQKIATLVDHLRNFLRLKPIERPPEVAVVVPNSLGINLKTVTASELNTAPKVNLVRDAALAIEATDVHEALRLMRMAKKARPNGPKICQKVEEYESILHQNKIQST